MYTYKINKTLTPDTESLLPEHWADVDGVVVRSPEDVSEASLDLVGVNTRLEHTNRELCHTVACTFKEKINKFAWYIGNYHKIPH